MSKGWEYILARSSDMSTIGKLKKAHNRTLEVDLNKSGSASCWIPTLEIVAKYVWPWRTCIIAQYDNVPFWSGPVVSCPTNMATGEMTISAVGWFDRLMHLLLKDLSTPYVKEDQGLLIASLLEKAKEQWPALPITMGTIEASVERTIAYSQDQNIGQAIIDLTELEDGTDWVIDPITRKLNIVARRGVDRPDCKWIFIHGDGGKSNLANVERDVDGTNMVNDIITRGKGVSGRQTEPLSEEEYGVFQEIQSLSDVNEVEIIESYAAAEVAYRSQPRVVYKLSPKPATSEFKVPKLFDDFDIGDTTYLTARRDFIDIEGQAERVFGASLSISDVGTTTINNLQTTAN